jgi:hypothetical protein
VELHDLGQPADIVVGLDRGLAAEGHRFDDIRVQRALGQVTDLTDLVGLVLEDFDEAETDPLALDLRVDHPLQFAEKVVGGIDIDDVEFALLLEEAQDRLRFAGPHQAVVDMDAGQLIADGPVDDGGHHRRIDTAGQGAEDPVAADPILDRRHRQLDEGMHGPRRAAVADAEDEVAEDVVADQGMGHLRVELHGDEGFGPMPESGVGRMGAGGGDGEIIGQQLDAITMAHPYLVMDLFGFKAGEQAIRLVDHQVGLAELALFRPLDPAAHLLHHQLGPVADPEDGNPQIEQRGIRMRGVGIVDRAGTAGEDNPRRLEGLDLLQRDREGVNLAVDLLLPDPSGDQLGGLRPEIEDEYLFAVDIHGSHISHVGEATAGVGRRRHRSRGCEDQAVR